MPGGATTVDIRPDGVGVLTLRHKPVNALSQDVCKSAKENLDKLIADPKVKAIVVTGEGKLFSGGADIVEFGMITMMDPAEAKKIGTSALQSTMSAANVVTLPSAPSILKPVAWAGPPWKPKKHCSLARGYRSPCT